MYNRRNEHKVLGEKQKTTLEIVGYYYNIDDGVSKKRKLNQID